MYKKHEYGREFVAWNRSKVGISRYAAEFLLESDAALFCKVKNNEKA
jgi:hypothetical protein